jgi:quercetin dioxygenase-like cupin family protein
MTAAAETGIEQFDLPSIARELRAGEAYVRDGHTARSLVRGSVLRVIFVVIRQGSKMSEHRGREQSSVHVVAGEARVQMRDRSVRLNVGQLLVLQVGEYHDIEATTDAELLFNIGWRADEPFANDSAAGAASV